MKIRLEDIRKAAIEQNWEVLSDEYKNLDTEIFGKVKIDAENISNR